VTGKLGQRVLNILPYRVDGLLRLHGGYESWYKKRRA
jgi:hypothetical protein